MLVQTFVWPKGGLRHVSGRLTTNIRVVYITHTYFCCGCVPHRLLFRMRLAHVSVNMHKTRKRKCPKIKEETHDALVGQHNRQTPGQHFCFLGGFTFAFAEYTWTLKCAWDFTKKSKKIPVSVEACWNAQHAYATQNNAGLICWLGHFCPAERRRAEDEKDYVCECVCVWPRVPIVCLLIYKSSSRVHKGSWSSHRDTLGAEC